MNLNLVFALAWLVAAAAIFLSGDPRLSVRLGGVPFSSGWVALVLALYNVARWWSIRSARHQRLAEREALARRFRHAEERREPVERDPNFDFTDPPAGPEGKPPPG